MAPLRSGKEPSPQKSKHKLSRLPGRTSPPGSPFRLILHCIHSISNRKAAFLLINFRLLYSPCLSMKAGKNGHISWKVRYRERNPVAYAFKIVLTVRHIYMADLSPCDARQLWERRLPMPVAEERFH